MAAATLEMDNKELKKQTEDIEEMISLLKQLTSGEKREVKGIMIGLQMAKQAGLTAKNRPRRKCRGVHIRRTDMKLNKEKFMKTEMGGELEETIRTWDKAIDERRKATPGIGNPDQGLGFKYWDNTCRSCQDRWEVFKLAIKQFYGIEFFFTRTDEYFGVCSEDEQVWLIKEEKDTTKIGSKEYLVLADCLVDSCMMTWEIKADNDEQAYMKAMSIVRKTREADSGTCETIPIRGGAWADEMNSCFFKELKKVNGFRICEEYGKEYPDNMFALRG